MSTIKPPQPPTEEEIKDAVKERYEKASLPFPQRVKSTVKDYVLNHQPQVRLAILGSASMGTY